MDMSYLKNMPIAVLGGGAVGKTMAADCALEGKEVRIWDQPRFAKTNFLNIEKTGITLGGAQFSFFGYKRLGTAKVALATDDMAKAVKGAGIIIVAAVAVAHETIFRELIPLLEDGQVIHILPDNCGTFIFRKLMRKKAQRYFARKCVLRPRLRLRTAQLRPVKIYRNFLRKSCESNSFLFL